MSRRIAVWCVWMLLASTWTTGAALADSEPHGGMLRYPDVGPTHIVFVYANDLWLVPREGGRAVPLASPPGPEQFPRFSPDGTQVAFVGNYDGDRDLYTLPVDGGVPRRVTHHPANEQLCDWTPDGTRLLYHQNGLGGLARQIQLFTVRADGGLPERLAVPYGANGAISPDGKWLAYNLHPRDFATWKRYRGGWATDVWLFGLEDGSARTITDWEGTDTLPMWHGDTVYYLSDAGPAHRLNLWAYDTSDGSRRQITRFEEYDVKWPSIGPGPNGNGEIVFQNASDIFLLDLGTGESRKVRVTVPGARPALRPQSVDAAKFIQSWTLSPTGKRALFSARGDVWTVPAKDGTPRNLTRTDGFAERYPSWSPDGKWIAYSSDESGEYEVWIRAADGRGQPRRISEGGPTHYFGSTWSPDSKKLAYTDKAARIYLHDLEAGTTVEVDRDPWGFGSALSFSHDGKWIAYGKNGDNLQSSVWLYDVDAGKTHRVTSGMFNDTEPTFDREGKFLYYVSGRDFKDPVYEDVGTTFVYTGIARIVAVPLNAEVENPLAPKSDEEEGEKKDEDGDDGKDDSKKGKKGGKGKKDGAEDEQDDDKDEPEPVKIDLDGFEARGLLLPVDNGRVNNLHVSDENKLLFARRPLRPSDEDKPSIRFFDLQAEPDERKEKAVFAGTGQFTLSADGKKLMARKNGQFFLMDPKPDQKPEAPVPAQDMKMEIDPREEWRQIFLDAWRIQRDFFYLENMHGVDWPAIREQYLAMLGDCQSRADLGYVLSEMIAELNVGHAYYGGGDVEDQPSENVGMLGVDFEAVDGAYRIARILRGAAWDLDARGPLDRPGVDVSEGDFLLAVNGVPVDTGRDPWSAFVGLADKTVTLTVSAKPVRDDDARDAVVRLTDLGGEIGLRYRAWVEDNRRYVAEKTGGRVGYLHVPNTGVDGQNELFRQFYGQVDRGALIVDERWNAGGQIPTRFIELLNRPRTNYWARRDGRDWPWPPDSHQGPKCMLINGPSGSGGDAFPWYFRQAGVGKLIGRRTWGGLVGISGNPGLIDGAFMSVPTFGFYETDGTWGVEGHGVDPDVPVLDDPAVMARGRDPQLDRAIELMLEELESNPYTPPARPASPDRSGMGLPESDR